MPNYGAFFVEHIYVYNGIATAYMYEESTYRPKVGHVLEETGFRQSSIQFNKTRILSVINTSFAFAAPATRDGYYFDIQFEVGVVFWGPWEVAICVDDASGKSCGIR